MDDVYPLLDSADAIAVATPVFFATVPCGPQGRCTIAASPTGLVATCWVSHRPHASGPAPCSWWAAAATRSGPRARSLPTNSIFGVLGVSLDHVLEVVGPDEPRDIERYPDELERAHAIGMELGRGASGAPAHG